jgi:hypothetical protein
LLRTCVQSARRVAARIDADQRSAVLSGVRRRLKSRRSSSVRSPRPSQGNTYDAARPDRSPISRGGWVARTAQAVVLAPPFAFFTRASPRGSAIETAIGAVSAVTLADAATTQILGELEQNERTTYPDYSARSGFRHSPESLRGAAITLQKADAVPNQEPLKGAVAARQPGLH